MPGSRERLSVTERPKVLVIAEAANPILGERSAMGWNTANALREVADAHIVTQVCNRDAIASHGLLEGRDFTAIDSEALAAPFYRMADRLRGGAGKALDNVTALQSLSYPYFEHYLATPLAHRLKLVLSISCTALPRSARRLPAFSHAGAGGRGAVLAWPVKWRTALASRLSPRTHQRT